MSIVRRIALFGLLFWCCAGNLMAQSNAPLYVIKMEGQNNYLSHSGSGNSATLQNATSFSPNCLWYSGPNVEYNYYFIDEAGNYRYLSAPLQLNGTLSLTDFNPGTVVLNQPSSPQYFYDWDHGVARGERQSSLDDCEDLYNGLNENGTQCWKVVWVSYENSIWQMSSQYGYDPTPNSARYKKVTKTEHPVEILDDPAPTGGLPTIADFAMTFGDAPRTLNGTASSFSCTYRPAYTTYVFEGGTHNYFGNADHGTDIPGTSTLPGATPASYAWTLSGEGAQYLSLSAYNIANPTLAYQTENTTTSHKMATLTLTATYAGGVKQVRTVTVTVKTACQNPIQASVPVVTYDNVTLSWVPTAEKYRLQWRASGEEWSAENEVTNITASSYTFAGSDFTALGYGQAYDYRVSAYCGTNYQPYPDDAEMIYHFSTFAEPGLFIFGSVYGGGRMANVNGNTEVVVIDCDSVSAVYGGNDIAGTVSGSSNIVLGVNKNDANATAYNNGNASTKVRVFDVYGGGNGYYAYNGTSFEAASSDYDQQEIAVDGIVKAMTQTGQVGDEVWTNTGASPVMLTFPKISSASITVTNDQVRVDSIFGGAKNAFITTDSDNGSTITFNGGTAYAVFGGNNIGGGQGYGKHHIDVVNTKTNLAATRGFGRSFGIGYLFGGGNKVYGSTTEITISGGQCDTVFAGGNSASVYDANVTVNCPMDAGSSSTFGNVYTNAITAYTAGDPPTLTMNDSYAWDGYSGVYNVRTLFGGNNRAKMEIVPSVTLTSGSVGTVYGGGNAGDMMAQETGGSITFPGLETEFDNYSFDYSTKVVMNSPTMLVDYLYGGCQMSNVGFSSWVQIQDGHVGTVYGGCNISGDVGSTRVHLDASPNNADGRYQEVYGATYVEASGGFVHKNVFAGSNGFYHCLEDLGIFYKDGINYDPLGHSYVGTKVPTHNETHVVISGTATVEQNVYAGGNMAPVGFTTTYVNHSPDAAYPQLVGMASVRMIGGEVKGNVYGGGCMASINGSNEVRVTGGSIGTGPQGGALYGGNDRLGKAGASGMSNRKLRDIYNTASDHNTPLVSDDENQKVLTYVGVSGNPQINTVYGGGNGAYKYTGPEADMQYCDVTNLPIQSNIFVDIAIDGGNDGGYISNVYGGGNGVYANGFIKVFLNVKDCAEDTRNHIGTIYGGNNMGNMEEVVPEIILLHGNVGTVYGGCNSGAMLATDSHTKSFTINGSTYNNVASYVHLLDDYVVTNTTLAIPETTHTTPTAKVTGAVYGGCRMNDVTNNSLVLVESGNHSTASMFGGSDISGIIGGTSRVVVTGGTVGNIYGGGNGNYDYTATAYQGLTAPKSSVSQVDILGGQVGTNLENGERNIFGGGWGALTETTGNVTVNIGTDTATAATYCPIVYGDIYGGSALGSVNTSASNNTIVNILNGTVNGNIYGGGLGQKAVDDDPLTPDEDESQPAIAAIVKGKVFVNIGKSDTYDCFIDLREANVYGCNNANGSPQDSVTVNVYQTAHSFPTYPAGVNSDNYLATYSGNNPQYSIRQVFGGGNQADYAPENGSVSSTKVTTVNVIGCDNTIGRTFGGGNAAAAHKVESNIYGGRFHQVFGGGNGESSPANIGSGGATLNVYKGNIIQLFGGNNLNGEILGPMSINITNEGSASCDENITEFFGGSNKAVMGSVTPVNLVTTIECSDPPVNIHTVYGGSNLADITGNVTLNIYGGQYQYVYGGSKGQSGSDPDDAADIDGTVTLNLYGGSILNAFGGSNINGNITNVITVNVLDHEATGCELDLTNVYGASNQTAYTPTNSSLVSPVVNVMHIAQTEGIKGNVFGGGNEAPVSANPQVNIGYLSSMSSNLPTSGFTAPAAYRAYVSNSVFGGGNKAGVTSPEVNMNNGTVLAGIYGGCNTNGNVSGNITVNIFDGTLGVSGTPMTNGIFGGGWGQNTTTTGNVTVNIGDGTHAPTIYADVYGGGELGKVHTQYTTTDKTTINFAKGTLNGNLYGGGLGQAGTPGIPAEVYGSVEVNLGKDKNGNTIDGGTIRGSVFGANNLKGAPEGNVAVHVYSSTIDSIFGGGNQAHYEGTPEVNIHGGTINYKVFGGGNNISGDDKGVVGGNVLMSGGTVLGGIYGGCNTDGDVTGDVTVALSGGTIGSTDTRANIHGGGYGHNTSVKGNVTVTFGAESAQHNDYPKLYGDLYGGSALGTVNTNNSNTTTVNVLNGTITSVGEGVENYGNVFGGGLGNASYPATVNGVVRVNIGNTSGGQASIARCNVYGCNNQNGSPQDEVYVSIYETTHTLLDNANYFNADRTYAIYQVFGGGNQAHYAPENGNPNSDKKTHVHVYNCDNTAQFVYGGGNAADAVGVVTIVEGGRFSEIYGGGNGRVTPANIGLGDIGLNVVAGNVGFLFEGSNKEGVNLGGHPYKPSASSDCLGGLFVDSYFFGTNEAELYGDLSNIITCEEAGSFEYRYVYAGSRWGIVYGDISLTVCGGTIENLFGGCRGYSDYSADVRRFPTFAELDADYQLPEAERKYSDALRNYMGFDPAHPTVGEPAYAGHGGNITLIVNGGTIGNVFGGCDIKGNVEGKISLTVCDAESTTCPLFVGNVYGASNMWYHDPEHSDINSPEVKIIRGTIGGSHTDLPVNNVYGSSATDYEGNVFGGGNHGNVTANPKVIVGDGSAATPVTIKGDVYGGGNEGDVTGSPRVIIVPQRHALSFNAQGGGSVTVNDGYGNALNSGSEIGEGIDLSLTARPNDYAHRFTGWTLNSGTGASIMNLNASATTFTMGTDAASITASFETVTPNTLTWTSPTGGTFTVNGSHGNVTSGTSIGAGVQLSLAATASPYGYKFKKWTVTGTGTSVANENSATTTFTMGSAPSTITAEFETVSKYALTIAQPVSGGSFTVKDYQDNNVASGTEIGVGAVLNLVATPSSGFAFSGWTITGEGSSVDNLSAPTTTFTMGTAATSLTASFTTTHTLNITPPTNGAIRITNSLGEEVTSGNSVGEGATLNLKATPPAGYAFNTWTVSGENTSIDSIANPNAPITSFTMGTATTTTIGATFITAHVLSVIEPEQIENSNPVQYKGTVKVTTSLGQTITGSTYVGVGAQLTIEATPADGYQFTGWTVTGTGSTVSGNTFTMGTADATIKANFEPIP